MIRFIILLTVLLIAGISANAKNEKVRIHGQIQGLGENEIVLLKADYSEITKTKGINDKFEITANLDTGDGSYYFLYVPSVGPLGPSMSVPTLFLFADSPDIEISAVIKDKQVSKNYIKGSPMMAEYESIFRNLPVREELEKASVAYNKAFDLYNRISQTQENLDVLEAAGNKLDSLQKSESGQLLALIPQMKKSKALAMIIYEYNNYKPVDELEELLNQFDPSIRNCYGLARMQEKINLEKGCEIGQSSPDFELKDLNGQLTKLSSLRGKYTLIDFWASWCGPCRQEIPNLKKVYAEYKDKGLQLIGVSIDNSEAAWQKAVKEEQLDYLQLNDPKNITGKLYNFNGIPFIILISPEGVILEKGLRGAEVREKVAKYLN